MILHVTPGDLLALTFLVVGALAAGTLHWMLRKPR